MRLLRSLCIALGALVAAVFVGSTAVRTAPVLAQPVALAPLPAQPTPPPGRPVTETLFGTTVVDPYRYFENMKDPAVVAFFRDQNAYTRAVLDHLNPARQRLFARIRALDNVGPRVYNVTRVPERYFYLRRNNGENVAKLYVRDVASGRERVLVDPDTLTRRPGKHTTIEYYLPSQDGRYVAYGTAEGGSENSVIHVVETATARVLPDAIDRAFFVGATAWLPDGTSFYYVRYPKLAPGTPETEKEQRSVNYLHVLGRNPDQDTPVFGFGVDPKVPLKPDDIPIVALAPGSPYALGIVAHGVQNEQTMYVAPAASVATGHATWTKIVDVGDDVTASDFDRSSVYLVSHKDASTFKVLAMRLDHPDVAHAAVLVPPGRDIVEGVGVAADGLYVRSRNGGFGVIRRVALHGEAAAGATTSIRLPYEGAIASLVTDARVPGATVGETGWTHTLLYYAVSPSGAVVDTKIKPPAEIDASGYTSREVEAKSADGTMIPMSMVFKRGIVPDGSHVVDLEGYGAYGVTETPGFDPLRIAWMERGGIYADCHVRGGGWYGEDWHHAGMIATKEHTIEDYVACARWLIDNKYTTPQHMGGEGTSAGGITIGGAITQHPELFSAALDVVGVSDALRSEFSANGPSNIPEFGTVKDPQGFRALYEMDAYQHVKDGTKYPAVMLITGINDPRVSPWELGKFAARLQKATTSGRPVLLRVDYDAGHGFLATSRTQAEELQTDEYAFFLWQLGDPEFASVPMQLAHP